MIHFIKHAAERILRGTRRRHIAWSNDPHPTSDPFISGDGFRSFADHHFEPGAAFDPGNVKLRDIVFVSSSLTDVFFSEIHPHIKYPYILITHNGDRNITEDDLAYIDEKIICWFGQNVRSKHPKLVPIPIGLENKSYAHAGWTPSILRARELPAVRNGRILVAFTIGTNPTARSEALSALRKHPLADLLTHRPTQRDYLALLRHYSYVASPPGNGEDCHRTWESIALGAVPIVSRSHGVEEFVASGAPIHLINNWHNLHLEHTPEPDTIPETDLLQISYWRNFVYTMRDNA